MHIYVIMSSDSGESTAESMALISNSSMKRVATMGLMGDPIAALCSSNLFLMMVMVDSIGTDVKSAETSHEVTHSSGSNPLYHHRS